ncbi:hypothetical protein BDF20DRAFT_893628 [Mycotypha africana]|uniref:uncharacterized protein n=1 Tax=Mycotypha africana TaxID=64632 RepID=UPI00230142B3|nr:uncharacterized protein BDF20DRAFT_893628 [Mycotypha africana]KAI8969187.1 hypothetical protein BDF20DRAFT_893628 [Mycotypha africana]
MPTRLLSTQRFRLLPLLLLYFFSNTFAQDAIQSTPTLTNTPTATSSSLIFYTSSTTISSITTTNTGPNNNSMTSTATNALTITTVTYNTIGTPTATGTQNNTKYPIPTSTTINAVATSSDNNNNKPTPSNTDNTVQGTGWNYNANDRQTQQESWLKQHNRFVFIIFVGLFLFGLLFWYIYKSVKAMRKRLEEENQAQLYMIDQATGHHRSSQYPSNNVAAVGTDGLVNNSSQQPVFQPTQQQSTMTTAVGSPPLGYFNTNSNDKTEVESDDNIPLPTVSHPQQQQQQLQQQQQQSVTERQRY